jgi:hypothetical protein
MKTKTLFFANTMLVVILAALPSPAAEQFAALRKKSSASTTAINSRTRSYWAYRTVTRPRPPVVRNRKWVSSPIDAFLLSKIERAGLKPASPATKQVLIRRAYYDLLGLPPTMKEVQAFISDKDPKAYDKLLDTLLARPQYGEKWGRFWLDLVRYSETNGYERDSNKPNVHKYRDYVIRAFNQDKPYNQFLMEQLAGDEMTPATEDSITATGYMLLGVWDDDPADKLLSRFDELDGIVSTTSSVMLGMSVGCARCHDHKKDPILQKDYYTLLAFFNGLKGYRSSRSGVNLPDNKGKVLAVSENGTNPPATHILKRGLPAVRLAEVKPAFPTVLGYATPTKLAPAKSGRSSGRRLYLAQWIGSKKNKLTARVMANRLWQMHMGRGIVPTPNDFGNLGRPPTHPKLLDWLASEFMAQDWSMKKMHKIIMSSSAYRMSSQATKAGMAKDPANNLFWHFNMRRFTAEEIRDSILVATGELNLKMGGASVYPEQPREVMATSSKPGSAWGRSKPEDQIRRSIYIKSKRSLRFAFLESLDQADTDNSCAVRFTTTVPTQALTMINSKFLNDSAGKLAERAKKEAGPSPAKQVALMLTLVTQRKPTAKEIGAGVRFLAKMKQMNLNVDQALKQFGLIALNLNESVYID